MDFNVFLKQLNPDTVNFDAFLKTEDIPLSKRTISNAEWTLIAKCIAKYNVAILWQYHLWLAQNPGA